MTPQSVEIPTKRMRKAQRYYIGDGLYLFEFNGKKVVPVSDSEKYTGVPVATIRDWVADGKLKRYQANGLPKKGSGKEKVFICYDEFLRLTNI